MHVLYMCVYDIYIDRYKTRIYAICAFYRFSALVRLPVHSLTSRGHSQGHSHSFCSILKGKRKITMQRVNDKLYTVQKNKNRRHCELVKRDS